MKGKSHTPDCINSAALVAVGSSASSGNRDDLVFGATYRRGRARLLTERQRIANFHFWRYDIFVERAALSESIGPFGRVALITAVALLFYGALMLSVSEWDPARIGLIVGLLLSLLVLNRARHPELFRPAWA